MLLTSWIDSMRRTWQRDRLRRRRWRPSEDHPRGAVEQLEDRTLLSSVVIESVAAGQSLTLDTQTMVGDGTLSNPEFDTLAIRSVEITPGSGAAIDIDFSGDDTAKLELDTISIQSVIATGNGDSGLQISLQDVSVGDLVVDTSLISGANGAGLTIALHDTSVDALTIVRSTIAGDGGAGTRISLDGATVRELNVATTTSDGISISSVPGDNGVVDPVSGVSSTNPISVTSLTHGLSTGDVVTISGVIGNSAVNGNRVVTVVDTNTFTVDSSLLNGTIDDVQTTLAVQDASLLRAGGVMPFTIGIGSERLQVVESDGNQFTVLRGVDGTTAAGHTDGAAVFATASNGTYISGGEWVLPSSIFHGSVKENRLEGATGSDGLKMDLLDTAAPRFSITDNFVIEGVEIVLDGSPLQNLTIHNNLLTGNSVGAGIELNAIDSNVDGVITENRVVGNATNGVQFDLTDSNLGGRIVANTVENNAGDGIVFNADSTSGLRTLNFNDPDTIVGDITDASNDDPIRITSQGHGLKRGDLVYIEQVRGNVAANGTHHVGVSETALSQGLNLLQTEVTVDDVSPFLLIETPDPTTGLYDFLIRIDDERMLVTGVDGVTNVFTVVREVDGTLASSHVGQAPVFHDSVFTLEGSRGSAASTGVYSGGGSIRYASGGLLGNTIRNNTAGAGIRAELPENTVLLADVAGNTLSGNSEGGFILRANDTNPAEHGASAFLVTIGGEDRDTDANVFDSNTGAGMAFTLVDKAAGSFEIRGNTIINTINDNDTATNYVGDAIHAELLGASLNFEAINALTGAVIESNSIGTVGYTELDAAINGSQTTITVADSTGLDAQSVPFNVQVGREVMTVTGITGNNLAVARGVLGTPNEPHVNGDTLFSVTGGNQGRGFSLLIEEDSAVADLLFSDNTVVNNADDGFKLRREDEGRLNLVDDRSGQRRAVTIQDNTFIGNASNAPSEVISPGASERRGAGIDIHAFNGSIDLQDVEIVRNVIEANVGTNTSGILLRAEADARVLVDIEDNRIRYNSADGIELSTRQNDATDVRQVGGTWIKNTITDNGGHGIEIIGRHGLYDMISGASTSNETVLTPLFIGIEGVDPADGKDRGNIIESNALDGMTVNAGGSISFSNNSVKFNSTGGIDINPSGLNPNQTTAIKSNDVVENVGIGIDVNVTSSVVVTIRDNLVKDNIDSNPGDAVLTGDGIELSTLGGTLHATLTGNFIGGNDGRGIDLLNTGITQLKIGDPTLPLDTGRNSIVGNTHEGLYVVNTADPAQPQDVVSSTPMSAGGDSPYPPSDIMLHVDSNTIEDNGVGSSFVGTGVLIRSGTVNGGGPHTTRNPSGDSARLGGQGTSRDFSDPSGATGVGSNDGAPDKGNGRINARIANNSFEGNFGNDFYVDAFVSTVPPATTSGTWTQDDFIVNSYSSDPLVRVNLVIDGNTGNGLSAQIQGSAPVYNNDEQDFKRRQTNKTPAGAFPSGTQNRSACHIPFRGDPFGSVDIAPTEPQIGAVFQFPGLGPERTFRVLDGFDTAGSGPDDEFELGSNFDDPGTCGWDIVGTFLSSFVSESATSIQIEDPDFFVGGNGDDGDPMAQGFSVQIGLEEMQLTPTGNPEVFLVERGFRNTPISAHLANAAVGFFTFPDPDTATFPLPDIVDVTPGVRNTDAGVVEINFSEDMRNVAIDDFALAYYDGTESTRGVITGATHVRPDGTKEPLTITSIGVGNVLSDGDEVTISGILGNGAANGVYTISNVTANTFDLGVDETQLLELIGNPTGGTFTLTYVDATNEVQRIEMTGLPMDGHFALGFRPPVGGTEFTDALEWTATAAEVQAALEGPAIPTLNVGDVIVTGGPLAGVNELQEIDIQGGPAGGDVYTLTYLHPATVSPNDIDDTTGTLTVNNAAEFLDPYGNPLAVPFPIRLDDEDMIVTSVVGDDLTVNRGQNGTAASPHTAGTKVHAVQRTIPIPPSAPAYGALNEVQRLGITGGNTGDTFTLSFLHPDTQPGLVETQFNGQLTTVSVPVEDFGAMTDPFGAALPQGVLSESDQFNIRVDDEEMLVTAVDTASTPHILTVVRGINGTDPAIHNAEVEIFYVETTGAIEFNAPADDSRTDIQRITMSGDPDGGDFTLTFQHPESLPTTLDGTVDNLATTTTLAVNDVTELTDGFGNSLVGAEPFNIRVDDELMRVTALDTTANTLEVVRAINGTTIADHTDTTEVFEVQTTRRISFDAPADGSADEQQQLSLVGGPDGGTFTLSFLHPEAAPADLFGINETQRITLSGAPTGGSFTLLFQHPSTSQALVDTAVTAGDPTVVVDDDSVFVQTAPFQVRIDDEILTVDSLAGDGVTLNVTGAQYGSIAANHLVGAAVFELEETQGIAATATAGEVTTALGGLNSLAPADVVVLGGDLPGQPITVEFVGALARTPIVEMLADGGALTGGTGATADVTTDQDGVTGLSVGENTVYLVDVTAMTDGQGDPIPIGTPLAAVDQFNIRIDDEEMRVTEVDDVANTFTVNPRGINGTTEADHLINSRVHFIETTGVINFDADAAAVQAALEALNQITSGDVLASGGALPGTDVDLDFTGTLEKYDVAELTGDGTLLTVGGVHSNEDVQVSEQVTGVLSVETALELLDEILDNTTLNGAVDNLQETVVVNDASVFTQSLPFTVRIDNEDLSVTAIVGNTLSVIRGHNSTTPTVHDDASQVKNNVSVSGGDLPEDFVSIEFLGTLEHFNIRELIADSRLLTEGGLHGDELADITTEIDGALSVETAMERLPSIIGPETDINVVGGPLGTSRVYIEFRGPVLGGRDIEFLYGDEDTNLSGGANLIVTSETEGELSIQKALVKLPGITNGSVLVTIDPAAPNPPLGMPFFNAQVEFTRYLAATNVPALEATYIGVQGSTAGIQLTTTQEGVRRTPLEIEFDGGYADVDVIQVVAGIDELPLVLPDDFLFQWKPENEDVILESWEEGFLAPPPPSQDPVLNTEDPDDYICFTDVTVTCETFLTGVNEMQAISIQSLDPDSHNGLGSYRLKFKNDTTDAISVFALAGTVKSELESLGTIGEDDIVVRGGPLATDDLMVEFVNSLSRTPQPMLEVVDLNPATGNPTLVETTVDITRYLPGDEPGTGINVVELINGGPQVLEFAYNSTAAEVQERLERSPAIAVVRGQVNEATNATPIEVTSPDHGLADGDRVFITGASVDGERTRLAISLDDTIQTVVVEDGTAFSGAIGSGATIQIRIDFEDMIVTDRVGDTLTVIRGANGTPTTTHQGGQRVNEIENTVLNGEHQVTVIDEDLFTLQQGGSDVVGDGDYAGGGRWIKLGNVEVSGGPLPDDGLTITFTGDLSHRDVEELEVDGGDLEGDGDEEAVINTLSEGQGIAAAGDYIGGGQWTKNLDLGPGGFKLSVHEVNDIQEISFSQANLPTGGTFRLSFKGTSTTPIAFDATAAEVAAVLTDEVVISSIGVDNVIVTGGPLPQVPIQVEFVNSLKRINQPEMEIDGGQLSGISSPAGAISTLQEGTGKEYTIGFDVNAVQRVAINGATAGNFSLQFDNGVSTLETAPISFDATNAEVRSALELLATIDAGDVIVTGGQLPDFPVDVEFSANYALTPVVSMVVVNAPGGATPLTDVNGQPVVPSLTVQAEGRHVTGLDGDYILSILTDDEGPATVDLLSNRLTQLVDGAGNTLNLGAQDFWTRDEIGAIGNFVPVSPPILHTAVGVVTLNFDEPVTGVDIADFVLTRDNGSGPVAVGLGGIGVQSVDSTQYTLDLNLKTGAAGDYVLQLVDTDPVTPIQDAAGNVAAQTSVTWSTNITAPTASFTAIATPRNLGAGVVTIDFTEDVTGFDITDLTLTRDGQPVSLLGLSLVPVSGSQYTIDLDVNATTDPEGLYELSMVASGSDIIDDAGNALPNDVSVSWVMDTTAPTADILDVTPDPRTTDADIVNVLFDEPVDRTTVDIIDFTLTLDEGTGSGPVAVDMVTAGVVVQPEGTADFLERFTLDLRGVTDTNGSYSLTLTASGSGIVDEAGGSLVTDASDTWQKTASDTTAPVADIEDVDPDPRITAVNFVTITFSEDVTGVDIDDFSLTLDEGTGSGPVAVDLSALTTVEVTPRRYAIDMSTVSSVDGAYVLTLNASGANIDDAVGNTLLVDASDDWVKGNTGPTADIVDVTPDPRIEAVETVAINFTDPVTGVEADVTGLDVGDFQLRRDGLLLDLSEVTLTEFSGSSYELVLEEVTAVDGAYDLRLVADGSGVIRVSDSEPLVLDAIENWVIDTVIEVNSTLDLVDATPHGDGIVDADLGTPGFQITLRAAIQEANQLPGPGVISLPAGDYTLALAGSDEDNAATGDLDIRQDLEIIGEAAGQTTIDADGLERVFQIFGGVTVRISDVTITGGVVVGSEDGGGIRSGGDLTLENVVVTGNTAEDSGGGINTSGSLALLGSTVSANSATGDGGGVRNTGTISVLNSEISANSSGLDGGGLVNIAQGEAGFNNSTFSGNTAGRDGGAIHNEATVSLGNATIAYNNAEQNAGGVSSAGGSVTSLQNTMVALNTATLNFADLAGTFTTLGNNLIRDNSGADASFPAGVPNANGDLVGDPSSLVDPLIEDTLNDNGGQTRTHLLLIGSPAIDAGNNAGLDANVNTEQRGAARVLDGPDQDTVSTVDIGAVEFGNFYVNSLEDLTDTTPLGDGLVDGDLLTLGKQITLRAALQEANALMGENTIQLGAEVYTLSMSEPDTVNPTADIVDITPDPRDTAVDAVTINFSEDVLNVDLSDGVPDFVLTRDVGLGPQAVSLTGIALQEISNSQYTLDLSTVTDVNGIYSLTLVATASSIVDLVGNPLIDDAVDDWRIGPDVYAPTADIVDIFPDPRSTDADPVTINFSESVVGVDVTDLKLEIDFGGGLGPQNVPLDNSTLQQVTASEYLLTFEAGITSPNGTYTLTLVANGSGIQDLAANDLAGDATDSWVRGTDTVPPTADIVDVFPDPRITNVGLVTVDFNEAVTGVDIGDFTLTRDAGSGAVNVPLGSVVVTQLSASQYTLNMSTVTGFDGDYVLTLDPSIENDIFDVAPNLMVASASDSWSRGESSDGAGDLDITDTTGGLTIIGVGSAGTVIDANGIDRAFQVLENVTVTLRGLTVTGGVVTGSSEGGAIFNSGALLISDVTVSGNQSQASGGGLYNTLGGTLTVDESDVSGNTALDGGGIYNNDDGALVIRNSAVHDNVAGDDGGGVYNDLDGDLNVVNSDLIANVAVGQGGGIYNNDSASVVVNNSRFSVNSAEDGGAIFNELVSVLTIGNTTFSANQASDDGGAIYNDDGIVASTRNIFSGNTAGDAGGVLFNASNGEVSFDGDSMTLNVAAARGGVADNAGTLSLDGVTLSNNSAVDGGAIASSRQLAVSDTLISSNIASSRGGGLFNDDAGQATLTRTRIIENTTGGDGGGVYVTDTSDVAITFSTLSQNEAVGNGGGLFNATDNAMVISESLLMGNLVEGDGGGLYNNDFGDATVLNVTFGQNVASNGGGLANIGNLVLTHSTVYENEAELEGGGIFNAPTVPDQLAIRNTIVARNTGSVSSDVGGTATAYQSDGHNLIGDAGGVTFGETGDQVGSSASPLDPSLFDLKFNGGPTQTHGLQFGSPARDSGDNAQAPATDQRGFARVFDGDGDGDARIDIGALESGFVVNSFEDTVDVNPNDGISADNDGNSSLRAAINEANAAPGGDTIILPAGTFLLSLTGANEDAGLTGDLDISGDLDILGAGAGETSISADGIDRVFHVLNGVTLNLFGVTITGGNAGSTGSGGGVLNHGSVSLNEAVVSGNSANRGGGVFNTGTLSVMDSTVQDNQANLQGGAVYNFQTQELDGAIGAGDLVMRVGDGTSFPTTGTFNVKIDAEELTVTAVDGDVFTVTRGVAGTTSVSHLDGATVSLVGGGVVSVDHSTISGNVANAQGGGIYNEAALAIGHSEIVQNVSNSRGGGIYNATLTANLSNAALASSTTIDLLDAAAIPALTPFDIFVDNEGMTVNAVNGNQFTVVRGVSGTVAVPHSAGAEVRLAGSAFTNINRSTLAENTAGSAGGGIFSEDTVVISTSTISMNTAGAGGGLATNGSVSLTNSTVTANSGVNAAGVAADGGRFELKNTIIAANIVSGDDTDVRGRFISSGNNLIGDAGSSTGLVHNLNSDQVGSSGSPYDPVMDSVLRDNGGPTRTHRLLPSSPAIDGADNTGSDETTDQRGAVRPTNLNADIGAFELTLLSLMTSDVSVVEGTTGEQAVNVSVILSDPSVEEISVDYATSDGTAFQGSDYQATSGTVTFAPGELTQNFVVLVNGDLSVEATENFFIDLSNAPGAQLLDTQAVVTIINDDTAVNVSDVSVVEADSGTVDMVFTVSLAQTIDAAATITVDYATADGTATVAGADYIATSGQLTFSDPSDPQQLSQTVTVTINGDTEVEPDETVLLTITGATVNIDDGQGVGTILNDDSAFTVVDNSILEGNFGTVDLDFVVSLVHASAVPVTVDYATSDGNEVQQVELTGAPTGGAFTLTYDAQTTGPISFDADATAVQTALEGLANISSGDVTVTGGSLPAAVQIEFTGALAGIDVTLLELDTNSLTGGTNPEVEIQDVVGSATAGDDYDVQSGTLTFSPGETDKTVSITVNGDVLLEPDEEFLVTLANATKDGVADTVADLNGDQPATGTILNDEDPPDIWEISLVDNAGIPTIEVVLNDVLQTSTSDLVTQLTVEGDDTGVKDDLFIVDFAGGNPIPANGLHLDGKSQTGADVVELKNQSVAYTTVDYSITGDAEATVSLDDGVSTSQVSYEAVEAVIDHTPASNRNFTLDSSFVGDHEMRTRNGSGAGNSLFEADGASAFGVFAFENPASALAFNTGPGNNLFTVGAMDALLAADVTINAGGGNDIVSASNYLDPLTINGEDGDDLLGGGAASDTVDGGAGNDSPGGGQGDDLIIGGVGTDIVTESLDVDFVLSDTLLNAGGGTDTLAGIELADLTGGDSNNSFDASAFSGSVTLNGAGGDDTMIGSAGSDQFNGDSGNDRIEQNSDATQKLSNTLIEIGDLVGGVFTATASDGFVSVEEVVMTGGPSNNVIDAGSYDLGDVTIDGAEGDDTLTGGTRHDSIIGGLGNDKLNARSGDDVLEGGDGNDSLLGGFGEDTLIGGDGNDKLNANAGHDELFGGEGNDRLEGATGDDTIDGGEGLDKLNENLAEGNVVLTDTSLLGDLGENVLVSIERASLNGKVATEPQGDNLFSAVQATIPVTMVGGAGQDTLLGGLGADYLNGNSGNDVLDGGDGDDSIQGGSGKDFLLGGVGDDTLNGQGSNDTIRGEAGDDKLKGGVGFDRVQEVADVSLVITDVSITGGLGTDSLSGFEEVKFSGGVSANVFDASGFSGRAILWGAPGNDTLIGGSDQDRLNGGPGNDSLVGNAANDTLFGGSGNDTLEGNGGQDVIYGQRHDDLLKGGDDADTLLGDDGDDILNGGEGDDKLLGGKGADGLSGWLGNDTLNGNAGKDTIIGGIGDDRMFGGNERDVMLGKDGDDYIKGQAGTDLLSGGPGSDQGVDFAVAELGNLVTEIDEQFEFFADWIDPT